MCEKILWEYAMKKSTERTLLATGISSGCEYLGCDGQFRHWQMLYAISQMRINPPWFFWSRCDSLHLWEEGTSYTLVSWIKWRSSVDRDFAYAESFGNWVQLEKEGQQTIHNMNNTTYLNRDTRNYVNYEGNEISLHWRNMDHTDKYIWTDSDGKGWWKVPDRNLLCYMPVEWKDGWRVQTWFFKLSDYHVV